MKLKLNLLLTIVLLLLACNLSAEEQNVNPGINDHYLADPDYRVWVGMFESPGREVYDKRKEVIRALDIKPGMDIADIGAGTGLYTRAFSYETGPQGKVYAVDIAPNFIDGIMRQVKASGVKNVVGIVNSAKDTGLEPASVDLAFVCDTYHHFEYPRSMLRSMHEALRPGGSLVIIDFRKIRGFSSRWVMSHTRADRKAVINEIESEGFELIEDRNFLKTNYYLRFVRK
jgi:predicted methyltransferase